MTGKVAPKLPEPWSPDDPITVDKAIKTGPANSPVADRLHKLDETRLARPARGKHPQSPANQKSFNRQKKG